MSSAQAWEFAVATITWTRSASEQRTLVKSLSLLAQAGFPVAVGDRGTNADFAANLQRIGLYVTVPAEQGLVAQVRASFELAATFGSRFILYVEPDKETLFSTRLMEFLRRAPRTSSVGIVLASRSPAAFNTFPPMQRYTESVANHLCGQIVGIDGDYTYGPFLVTRSLLPHIASLPPALGWGWRPSTFREAHRQGLAITHVIDDHWCPAEQQQEHDADRTHRLRQLSQNLQGLTE